MAVIARDKRAVTMLGAEPTSLAEARAFVTNWLQYWGYDDPEQVARLLTSEIVSNAVRHAGSKVELEIEIFNDQQLRVRARDDAPESVVERVSRRPEDEGGHGLKIVEALAERWGVERYPDHKVVWFETAALPRRLHL